MRLFSKAVILVGIIVIISSCRRDPYSVDISSMDVDIHVRRLEMDLFGIDPVDLHKNSESVINKYGEFLNLFTYVIDAGDPADSLWFDRLILFATDYYNYQIFDEVEKKYPELSIYESELESAWSHYKYYFPYDTIPEVYSFISGFRNSIIVGNSILAFGLDRYLGKDCILYSQIGIHNYIAAKMIPEKIVSDCMYAWASASWPDDNSDSSAENLLSVIMREGKLQYFTRSMLPAAPDSVLFGFTSGQMKFCRNNEYQMWEYLISHDFLFSTDKMLIKKMSQEAPFTSYFTNESPGRASVWLAFRIIESFMKHNPKVELSELMLLNDYQEILAMAKYSPSK